MGSIENPPTTAGARGVRQGLKVSVCATTATTATKTTTKTTRTRTTRTTTTKTTKTTRTTRTTRTNDNENNDNENNDNENNDNENNDNENNDNENNDNENENEKNDNENNDNESNDSENNDNDNNNDNNNNNQHQQQLQRCMVVLAAARCCKELKKLNSLDFISRDPAGTLGTLGGSFCSVLVFCRCGSVTKAYHVCLAGLVAPRFRRKLEKPKCLDFSRDPEGTLGTFWDSFCSMLSTKLGGVSPSRKRDQGISCPLGGLGGCKMLQRAGKANTAGF